MALDRRGRLRIWALPGLGSRSRGRARRTEDRRAARALALSRGLPQSARRIARNVRTASEAGTATAAQLGRRVVTDPRLKVFRSSAPRRRLAISRTKAGRRCVNTPAHGNGVEAPGARATLHAPSRLKGE